MEFALKGNSYRLAKLDLFTQLKVARKLAPLLVRVMSDLSGMRDAFAAGGDGQVDFDRLAPVFEKVLPRIADELASLNDEDVNAIIFPCLGVVARQHMGAWSPVVNQGHIAFDDIDLFSMITLVARVVADSLGNILPAADTNQTAGLSQA